MIIISQVSVVKNNHFLFLSWINFDIFTLQGRRKNMAVYNMFRQLRIFEMKFLDLK